jgi:hypothetical protein
MRMSLMFRRADPAPSMSIDEKERQLAAFESFMNKKWLADSEPHPVRRLWKRRDQLATTELLTVGTALEQLGDRITNKIRQDLQRRFRSKELGAREAAAFELVGAATFDLDSHPVDLPPAGQAGYDFALRFDDRRVRVSCKVLVPSAEERAFEAAGPKVVNAVREALPRHAYVGAVVELLNPGAAVESTLGDLRRSVLAAGTLWKPGFRATAGEMNWRVTLTTLNDPPDPFFWAKQQSHIIIATSRPGRDEQQRFSSKMNEALSNLRAHCGRISETETNVVLIKVPKSISIRRAKEMLDDLWPMDTEHVSAVYLYRSQVFLDTQQISHEFVPIDNPRALVPLRAVARRPIRGSLAFGIVQNHEVPRTVQLDRGNAIQIEGYEYSGGELFWEVEREPEQARMTLTIPRIPNVTIKCKVSGVAVDGPFFFAANYPSRDELVLI